MIMYNIDIDHLYICSYMFIYMSMYMYNEELGQYLCGLHSMIPYCNPMV